MSDSRVSNMTEGSIGRQMLAFALPFLITNILQQFYSTADAAIVGRLVGSGALAAIGSADKITIMLINLFLGFSTGVNITAAQAFGKGEPGKLSRIIHSGILLGTVCGLVLTIMGILVSPLLLELINTPAEVMADSVTYTRLYFLGMVPLMVYNMGAAALRALGDSKSSLYYLLISGFLNVLLDILFVGILSMGISGAAWATVITQFLPAVLVLMRLGRLDPAYRLRISGLCMNREETKEIIRIGFPAGIRLVFVKLSNLIIQGQINAFGVSAMAGATLFYKLDGYVAAMVYAIGTAVTSFAGQNYGAGRFERVKKCMRVGLLMTTVSTLGLSAIIIIFAKPLCAVFTTDADTIYYGALHLRYLMPLYFIFAWSEVFNGTVLSSGKSLIPMLNNMFGMCISRLAFALIGLTIHYDIRTIYLAYPFSWIVTHIGIQLYYRLGRWANGRRFAEAITMERQGGEA